MVMGSSESRMTGSLRRTHLQPIDGNLLHEFHQHNGFIRSSRQQPSRSYDHPLRRHSVASVQQLSPALRAPLTNGKKLTPRRTGVDPMKSTEMDDRKLSNGITVKSSTLAGVSGVASLPPSPNSPSVKRRRTSVEMLNEPSIHCVPNPFILHTTEVNLPATITTDAASSSAASQTTQTVNGTTSKMYRSRAYSASSSSGCLSTLGAGAGRESPCWPTQMDSGSRQVPSVGPPTKIDEQRSRRSILAAAASASASTSVMQQLHTPAPPTSLKPAANQPTIAPHRDVEPVSHRDILLTNHLYYVPEFCPPTVSWDHDSLTTGVQKQALIEVPRWRLLPLTTATNATTLAATGSLYLRRSSVSITTGANEREGGGIDEEEDTSDAAYSARHARWETDEVKRERRERERVREFERRERANRKEIRKWQAHLRQLPPSVATTVITGPNCSYIHPPNRPTGLPNRLTPDINRVRTVVVANEIPVIAFGSTIPRLLPRSFTLPWLKPIKLPAMHISATASPSRKSRKRKLLKS